MKPAELTVPAKIKTVALINRTLPENKTANIIEGILTAETPGQDRQAAFEALSGLNASLQASPRYQVKLTNVKIKGSGSGGVFPEPLDWNEVKRLADESTADAIISLETFDSDFIVTNGTKKVNKKNENGDPITVTEYFAEGVATVKLGFRFYDHSVNSIADQFHFSETIRWRTSGNNPAEALAKLIGRNQAIDRVSNKAGAIYASRIAPTWVRVSRTMYKKAGRNNRMKEAGRMALVNNWNEAADIWENVIKTSSGKTAGKAAYNLALAMEVLGDLESAKEWAGLSFSRYGVKKGQNYSYIINQRIWEKEKVRQQLGGNE